MIIQLIHWRRHDTQDLANIAVKSWTVGIIRQKKLACVS